jgi:hypothetical protein
MSSTRRHKAARKSPADWELHRKTIERLFLEERIKLDEVVERMAKQYQFHAKYDIVHIQFCHHLLTATSKPQYERQLKEWGIRINLKASEWQDLFQILSSLPDSGQYHEVRLAGQIIDADRLAREKLRRGVKDEGDISRSRPKTPKGVRIHPPPDVKLSPGASDTIPPTPEWNALVPHTYSVPLLPSSPTNLPVSSNMEGQHQHFSLGIFEPHAWTQAIDWSLLASLVQRNTTIAMLFHSSSISLDSVVHSSFINDNQLIIRGSDFLIPFYLLSSLLDGTEPAGKITNSQLHGVLRALPKPIVLKVFERLESPYSDMLRERIFASALDAGDADTVEAMLYLGLDPCEKIWFDSSTSSGSSFPLERALYFKKFSVCHAIVNHRCKPRPYQNQGSAQDQVLHELLESFYQLVGRYFPLTSSEWKEFSNLILTSLSQGAQPMNECFFVAFYDQSLASELIALDDEGVNGWIKRGLLTSRWPAAHNPSSATKAAEMRQFHWILTYILCECKKRIATVDPMVMAELVRALKATVEQKDSPAILIMVKACSDMGMRLTRSSSEGPIVDTVKSCLEQNWALAQVLIEKKTPCSQNHFFLESDEQTVSFQSSTNEGKVAFYDYIMDPVATHDDTRFLQLFEQYRIDTDLREDFHNQSTTYNQNLFKAALEYDQFDIVIELFNRLSLASQWGLAHILHLARTDAIYKILCNSETWSAALSLTLVERPSFSALENLMYRCQGRGFQISPLFLGGSSNADQQITLRCLCYYAIHTNNRSLLRWLVDSDLDMGELGQTRKNSEQLTLENIRKIAPHRSGLMPNIGRDAIGFHLYPSMLSVAAIQNNVSMIHMLFELGADGTDSMALQRAIESGAHTPTIEALLQVADLGNKNRRVRHYGSAALRETIRRKNYSLLQDLASKVDINGIELFPNELYDTRIAEPLSPIGEAILAQDILAIKILLQKKCNPDALVCYDGFPIELKRGAYLQRLSPLLAAIDLDDLGIVQILVENKASIAPGPTQGLLRSPLQRAAEVGSLEIVKYLLEMGAPVDDSPFHSGGTPLQLAALSGHVGVAELLIKHGANPDHPPAEGDGRTAFEAAAEWGRANIMSLLIKRETDLDLRFGDDLRSQYHRALHFAEENGHQASKRFVQRLYNDTVAARFSIGIWGSAERKASFEELLVEIDNMPHMSDGRSMFDG